MAVVVFSGELGKFFTLEKCNGPGSSRKARAGHGRRQRHCSVNAVAAAVPFLDKSVSASIVLNSIVSGFEADFAAGSYGAIKAALTVAV